MPLRSQYSVKSSARRSRERPEIFRRLCLMFSTATVEILHPTGRWKNFSMTFPRSVHLDRKPEDPDCPVYVVSCLTPSIFASLTKNTSEPVYINESSVVLDASKDRSQYSAVFAYCASNAVVAEGPATDELLNFLLSYFALPVRSKLLNALAPSLVIVGNKNEKFFGLKPYFEEIIFCASEKLLPTLRVLFDQRPSTLSVAEWPHFASLVTTFLNRKRDSLDVHECRLTAKALAAISVRRYAAWVEALGGALHEIDQIGRASCRERVSSSV